MQLSEELSRSSIVFRTLRLLLIGLVADIILSLLVVLLHAGTGNSTLLILLPFLGASILLFSSSAIVTTAVYFYLAHPKLRKALLFIVGLTLAVLIAHLALISEPNTNSIMDEAYYAPAGQLILNGIKSNLEHPPLSKALIAAGMRAFGSTCISQVVSGNTQTTCTGAFGFRILPAVLGTACIPLVFAIAWRMSKNKKIAYYSSALLALDTMFFVHSSAALLDIPVIFFALGGIVAYLYDVKFSIFDKYIISGVMMGLAVLSKETAIFLVAALLTFHFLRGKDKRRQKVLSSLKIILVAFVIFSLGLQTYDTALTGSSPVPTPTFVNNIEYILSYGSSLLCVPSPLNCPGAFHNPDGSTITPLNWLTYYVPTTYFGSKITACAGSNCISYVGLAYYGVTNMVETWSTFVWAPLAAYVLYMLTRKKVPFRKSKEPGISIEQRPGGLSKDDMERIASLKALKDSGAITEAEFATQKSAILGANSTVREIERTDEGVDEFQSPHDGPRLGFWSEAELAALALIIFCWSYFPYLLLFTAGRVTYPFYFLPAVPASALGISYLLTRKFFPRILVVLFFVAVFIWFIIYFPDKSFLPPWIRSAMGT